MKRVAYGRERNAGPYGVLRMDFDSFSDSFGLRAIDRQIQIDDSHKLFVWKADKKAFFSSSVLPVRVSRALSALIATPCRSPIPSVDPDFVCGGQVGCQSHSACHEKPVMSRGR
jgi:hypothetical protein